LKRFETSSRGDELLLRRFLGLDDDVGGRNDGDLLTVLVNGVVLLLMVMLVMGEVGFGGSRMMDVGLVVGVSVFRD